MGVVDNMCESKFITPTATGRIVTCEKDYHESGKHSNGNHSWWTEEQLVTAAKQPLPLFCNSNEVIAGKVVRCNRNLGHLMSHTNGEFFWVGDDLDHVSHESALAENKDQFPSGAQRDKQDGKPQYGLISPGFTAALAAMLTEKAAHYGDRNWEKGIPTSRSFESLNRHTEAMKRGEWMDEESGHPHAVLAAANLMFIFEFHGSEFDTMHELMGPSLRRAKEANDESTQS